jgi:hypothetical protein
MKVWTENTWKMEFYQRELKGGVVDAQDEVHLLIFLLPFEWHRSVGCWILLSTAFTAIRKFFFGSLSGTSCVQA